MIKINLRFKWRPNTSTESEIVRNEPYNPTDDYFKMLYSSSSDKYDSEACWKRNAKSSKCYFTMSI